VLIIFLPFFFLTFRIQAFVLSCLSVQATASRRITMDPRYLPAELSLERNNDFNPNFERGHLNRTASSSRTDNTWVQSSGPYSSNYPNDAQHQPFPQHLQQQRQTYLNGALDANGYPEDVKGPIDSNGYPVDVKGKQPYNVTERSLSETPVDSPRDSMDLEKQKEEMHAEPHDPHKKDPNQPFMPFGQRIKHFTWAWYTLTMSTGGLSTLLSIQPHAFPGLISIGAVFYIVNLIFFAALCSMMVIRFTKFPGTLKESVTHERESLFLATFFLSIATIITGTQKYVVESYEADHPTRGWITSSMAIAFWVYVFLTFCLAVFQYSFLFAAHSYQLVKFMPSWFLPIFPIMLAGTIASVIAKDQPISGRMPMLAAGMGCQGLGFMVAVFMYAHYIGRLMQVGYPNREHRGAMFIGVGPPSFTCLAFIGMANALPEDFDLQRDGLLDGNMLRTLALVAALFLWVLAMWFFMVAFIAVSLPHQTTIEQLESDRHR
jgi:C4-dicarboxylate transporter/malic acid transport protein